VGEQGRAETPPGALVVPEESHPSVVHERVLSSLSTPELVREVTAHVGLLAKKQIELAKAELRADLHREIAMVSGLGIGALAGILTVSMLFVTLVLALSTKMPGWLAGLLVWTAKLLGGAALLGIWEVSIAKMRVFRLPDFVGIAFIFGFLAILLAFLTRGAVE